MAHIKCNLSGAGLKVGVAVSRYYSTVADNLGNLCVKRLLELGVAEDCITIVDAKGVFELPVLCSHLTSGNDVVIAIGVLVKGETKHDQHIAQAVIKGLTDISLKSGRPVILGVLTTATMEQAQKRVPRAVQWAETAVATANALTVIGN